MTTQRRPLGCMTGIALVFGTLTILLVLAAALATGNGIFSPGPLNAQASTAPLGGVASHADLGGRCDACHAQAWTASSMAGKCLACHTAVGDELAAGTGLHGRFAGEGLCAGCHTEHGGSAASLTVANPADFPHIRTGFSLQAHPVAGRAGSFACADCHTDSVSHFTAGSCQSCHASRDAAFTAEHAATFGSGCRNCHDGIDSYGKGFTHASWALQGKHADASCAACHQGATSITALRSTTTACIGCHAKEDIHQARLGSDCSTCHTAASWQEAPATFDHALTTFPLTGKHTSAECLGCHVDRAWKGIGTTCESCHRKDDPHQGQFTKPCASCHTTDGWKPSTFDHATTRFALVDAHAKPACAACHANGRFVGTSMTCSSCHAKDDAHKGNLGSRCEQCHTATTWKATTFRHSQARFQLTGAHLDALCVKCHRDQTAYRGTPSTCIGCHRADDAHKGAYGTGCATCHSTRSWASTFDHARTRFPLTGAHTSLLCTKCHKDASFSNTPTSCVACHRADDAHGGNLGTACAKCHTTRAWTPATFDHSKTGFKLTGAHVSTACATCHPGNRYAGTPTSCYACHKKDDAHGGSYGTGCATCHSTKAWKPASFDHSITGFALTGGHKGVACTTCHKSGTYTGLSSACSSCHTKPDTHQPSSFSNCKACHTTSAWKPATYTLTHTFPKTHGGANSVCTKCHPSTWASYTCASCHSNTKMNEVHHDVAGFTLTSCAKCHPTGHN